MPVLLTWNESLVGLYPLIHSFQSSTHVRWGPTCARINLLVTSGLPPCVGTLPRKTAHSRFGGERTLYCVTSPVNVDVSQPRRPHWLSGPLTPCSPTTRQCCVSQPSAYMYLPVLADWLPGYGGGPCSLPAWQPVCS